MAATLSPKISFQVWDFSTVDGGGGAVVRTSWCDTVRTSSVTQHALYLGEGVYGNAHMLQAWSVDRAIEHFRALWSVPVDVRRCTCGCLAGTDR